jgi:gas vesicle protein
MRAFSYLLTGVGAGLVLGGLFAPKTGAESRKLLARRARKMRRAAKRAASDSSRYLKRTSAKVRDEAGDWIDRGKTVYRTAGKLVHAVM